MEPLGLSFLRLSLPFGSLPCLSLQLGSFFRAGGLREALNSAPPLRVVCCLGKRAHDVGVVLHCRAPS